MFRSGPLKGGLQEKMYFLLGCVRCASGKYDLIDRECDFQRKLFKNQILHDIFMENSKRYEKWRQDTAKVRKWIPGWAKVKERAPKVSQGTPKVSQKGAQSEQKGAQREPKGAKREAKVSQIQHKNNIKDKVAKSMLNLILRVIQNRPFWEPFPWKINEKNDTKIDAQKVMKFHQKSMRKWGYF